MNINKLVKKLTKHMKAIAIERDKLDELIGDADSLKNDCEEAYQELENARDALSRTV